jgi:hypothetical protein
MDDETKKVPPGRRRKMWPHRIFDDWPNRQNVHRAVPIWMDAMNEGFNADVLATGAWEHGFLSNHTPRQLAPALRDAMKMPSPVREAKRRGHRCQDTQDRDFNVWWNSRSNHANKALAVRMWNYLRWRLGWTPGEIAYEVSQFMGEPGSGPATRLRQIAVYEVINRNHVIMGIIYDRYPYSSKSKFGETELHKRLARLVIDKGLDLDATYEVVDDYVRDLEARYGDDIDPDLIRGLQSFFSVKNLLPRVQAMMRMAVRR